MERFGISAGGQLLEMLRFAGVGVALGVLYDVFRLWRLFTHPVAWRVFLQDLLYFALAAPLTLLAALPISSGRVRVIHLLALSVGFFCYYKTVGRLFYTLVRAVARQISRVGRWFSRHRARVLAKLRLTWQKREKKTPVLLKKIRKNFQKHLKPPPTL